MYALDLFSFQVGQKFLILYKYSSFIKINILYQFKLFCIWKWSMLKTSEIISTARYCMAS